MGGGSETVTPEDKDWDVFLDGIADKVGKLIVPQDGDNPAVSQRNFESFQEKVRTFGERDQQHIAATERTDRLRAELWQQAKADPRLQNKNGKPPKKGWEWDRDWFAGTLPSGTGPVYEIPARWVSRIIEAIQRRIQEVGDDLGSLRPQNGSRQEMLHLFTLRSNMVEVQAECDHLTSKERETAWLRTPNGSPFLWWQWAGLDDEDVSGCWRPPLGTPENPRKWLSAETEQAYVHPHLVVKGLPELDDERELERQYVVLASIYDNRRRGGKRITAGWPVVSTVQDPYRKDLCDWVRDSLSKCREYGPSRGYIEDAVGYVQADLAKRNVKDEILPPDRKAPKELDDIDKAIILVYQEWEKHRETRPSLRRPSYETIARNIQTSLPGVPHLSSQAVGKRAKKLMVSKLIPEHEKKKKAAHCQNEHIDDMQADGKIQMRF